MEEPRLSTWDLPLALIYLSCRVDETARRHSEEDPTLFQLAMTSSPVTSMMPQTSAKFTSLKPSQEAEKIIVSHSCNGKQQVNNLEDRTPTLAPWKFPSRDHSKVEARIPTWCRAEIPAGDLGALCQHQHIIAAGLTSLLGLIAEAQHQAAVVLEAASLSAQEHCTMLSHSQKAQAHSHLPQQVVRHVA